MESIPVLQGYHPDSPGFRQSVSAIQPEFLQEISNSKPFFRDDYLGCDAPEPNARCLGAIASVLNGDLNADDQPGFVNIGENAYHVVTADHVVDGVLDGFAITGGNGSSRAGGGLFVVSNSSLIVVGCRIHGNYTSFVAGGAAISSSTVHFRNCGVVGNSGHAIGGVVLDSSSRVYLLNCTLASNVSRFRDWGGGIGASGSGTSIVISGSVLWGNLARQPGEATQIYLEHGATIDIDYSNVEGWTGYLGGTGNVGLDPLFVEPAGADGLLGTRDDDFRLASGSPCINAGDPAFDPTDAPTDLAGKPRVQCARVDMGAFEFGLGDVDCNTLIDLKDVAALQRCFTSSVAGEVPGACTVFDDDADSDIDLSDLRAFTELLNPGTSP